MTPPTLHARDPVQAPAARDLHAWLADQPAGLQAVVASLARACVAVADVAGRGVLTRLQDAAAPCADASDVASTVASMVAPAVAATVASAVAATGAELLDGTCPQHPAALPPGATAQRLEQLADGLIASALSACTPVAGWASEEADEPIASPAHARDGGLLVVYDPLDGCSNIEANISIGTIFSVMAHPQPGRLPQQADFLQPASRLLAAGYVLYGPATVLVLTCRNGVHAFTLDRAAGRWWLTRSRIAVPAHTQEFAVNAANQRFWDKPIQRYIAECVAGEAGPRRQDFSMRWVASIVAEVQRILTRGGVFLYPRDAREPQRPARLRLLMEAGPMALLMHEAGGGAITGTHELLQAVPEALHERTAVILGSRAEIERIASYHEEPHENVSLPLFKTRSLFVQPQA